MEKFTFRCKHCNNNLEVDPEYTNQTATCVFCNQSIICPEVKNTTEQSPILQEKQRFSSAYCIGGWTEIALSQIFFGIALLLVGFVLVSLWSCIWHCTQIENFKSINFWGILAFVIPIGLGIFLLKFIHDLENPQRKIVRHIWKDIFWLLLLASDIFAIIYYIIITCKEGSVWGVCYFLGALISAIFTFLAYRFYIRRATEDENFSKQEIAADKTKPSEFRRRAISCALIGFIPLIGIPFALMAFRHIKDAKEKDNQQDMWRIELVAAIYIFCNCSLLLLLFLYPAISCIAK